MKQLFLSLIFLSFLSCKNSNNELSEATAVKSTRQLAKFEPEDGKCILFVGQELEAIGGLEEWNDGYLDHFDAPGGFTMYTKIRPGDEEFGFTYSGLAGVQSTDDWGDGPSNMSIQLADPDFENMALAIGLELVNHEGEVAAGELDSLVIALGQWLKDLGDRPVFLRIGYEFAGSWNHYDQEQYIAAYRRIKDKYDEMGVTNVAYVWQSHGSDEPLELLESWYPGDAYVDWCGYSFFASWDQANMITFARQKGKPVFIAEATPTIAHPTIIGTGKTRETILSNPPQAQEAWDQWFTPPLPHQDCHVWC
ncbi:MAG: glycosyl hydrolase [Bacteroidota bacterium]